MRWKRSCIVVRGVEATQGQGHRLAHYTTHHVPYASGRRDLVSPGHFLSTPLSSKVPDGLIHRPGELQAELDTLRSLRRRSVSQPSDGIDPDLPPSPSKYLHSHSLTQTGSFPQSPSSTNYHPASSNDLSSSLSASTSAITHDLGAAAGPSNSGTGLGGPPRFSSSDFAEHDEILNDDIALSGSDGAFGDGFSDLFWLPARLHPEIAPQEFRNFIKDQTKPENLMRRSGSMLGRKKSMLSKQYHPTQSDLDSSDNDNAYSSDSSLPSRTGSFRRSTGLEKLTLNDLQRLESLARQAAEDGQEGAKGEAQLKRLVRRSLSLNPAALLDAANEMHQDDDEHIEPFVDEADSPLIVPPPGSILRRSARTKIRKNSLLGDGGGHRFPPSRKAAKISPLGEGVQNGDAGGEGHLPDDSRKVSAGGQLSLMTSETEDDESLHHHDMQNRPTVEKVHESPSPTDLLAQPIPMQYLSATPQSAPSDDKIRYHAPILTDAARVGAAPKITSSMTPASPAVQQAAKSLIPMSTHPSTSGRLANQIKNHRQDQRHLLLSSSPRTAQTPSPSKTPSSAQTNTPSPTSSEVASIAAISTADPVLPRTPSKEAPSPSYAQLTQPASPPPVPLRSPELPVRTSSPKQGITYTQPQATTTSAQDARRQREPPALPSIQSHVPAPAPVSLPTVAQPPAAKEKEKKSGWARLGLSRGSKEDADPDDSASITSTSSAGSVFGGKDKKGKKGRKEKEISPTEKKTYQPNTASFFEKEKSEGSGGFFGGLFGSKKKADTEHDGHSARNTSQMTQMPTPSPTASGMLTSDGKYVNFYRLPIHIERAVYRLSHIKLANPRRPLYEQVLISNLMFWYLG